MLTHFICGSSIHPEHESDHEALWRTALTPPTRWRRGGKNPYSTRGLDKFSALLADLEVKRQQIYSQAGSQDISLVRFAYPNSSDCVPIVVKLRDKKQDDGKDSNLIKKHHSAGQVVDDDTPAAAGEEFKYCGLETAANTQKKTAFSWKIRAGNWRQPSFYLPAVVIFILLVLTVSGRSVAILCTCLGWYLVPAMKGGSFEARRPAKKMGYVRRKSDKMMVSDISSSSPKATFIRAVNVPSPGHNCNQKSL